MFGKSEVYVENNRREKGYGDHQMLYDGAVAIATLLPLSTIVIAGHCEALASVIYFP